MYRVNISEEEAERIQSDREKRDEMSFSAYKKFAKKAAKELFYGPEVILKISNAKTKEEISRILNDARNDKK